MRETVHREREEAAMAQVVLREVTKVFKGGVVAIDQVDLTVHSGEFVVLVGPSGCGKSTLLRMVAGLEDLTSGTIEIDGRVVNFDSPRERDVAMVFQNYALYPHYTVAQNIGFSLRMRHYPKHDARERVDETARVLGLESLLDRRPAALSGGQRQRVAMGRSLVRQPSLLLMDEPLSNLDAKLRVAMRGELIRLHQRYRTTTLYVTHDQVEAMTLGDRIAVLDRGRLQQVGTPDELYHTPCNIFVAGFIGSPAMNLAPARLVPGEDGVDLVAGGLRMALPPKWRDTWPGLVERVGHEVVFGVRPSDFRLIDPASADAAAISTTAVSVEALGDEKNVLFVPPFEAHGETTSSAAAEAEPPAMWTARVDPEAPVHFGDAIALRMDLEAAYFFDPTTQRAIPRRTAVPRVSEERAESPEPAGQDGPAELAASTRG
jgi:multiple sugar transport system ATP-binding protein